MTTTPEAILKQTRESVGRVRSKMELLRIQLRDGMKIYLQRGDGQFVRAIHEWTHDQREALVFQSTIAAIDFCHSLNLGNVLHLYTLAPDGTVQEFPIETLVTQETGLFPRQAARPD